MAVYDQKYRPYEGPIGHPRWRFLVIPRYAFRNVFSSRWFLALYLGSFLPILVAAIWIYFPYNTGALQRLGVLAQEIVPTNAVFFEVFTFIQCGLAYLITLIIGPALISSDLSNNALPLYLSRPLSRWEYVFGKFSVIAILTSVISWFPLLALVGFKFSLAGTEWLSQYPQIPMAVFVGCVIWIVVIALLALAISAWVRWRMVAGSLLVIVFLVSSAIGGTVAAVTGSKVGHLINLPVLATSMLDGLFRTEEGVLVNPYLAATMLLGVAGLSILVISRKLKAYEVVR